MGGKVFLFVAPDGIWCEHACRGAAEAYSAAMDARVVLVDQAETYAGR
jgi:hypothetical protein